MCSHNAVLWKHLRDQPDMTKQKINRPWVVEEAFPFPEEACGADTSPTSLCNLCHCFFLDLTDHLSSSHPLFVWFFFSALSLIFYLNSSTPPPHIISIFFPFLPSFLGYLFTTSLCHIYLCWSNVAGEVCLSRRWQETGDGDACLVLCLLALGEQEKLHWRVFDTSRVWSEWRDYTRGTC